MSESDASDGRIGTYAVYFVVALVCAFLAGSAGALWYVVWPAVDRPKTRLDADWQSKAVHKAVESDTGEAMRLRFWVGAGIGTVGGVLTCVGLHQKLNYG